METAVNKFDIAFATSFPKYLPLSTSNPRNRHYPYEKKKMHLDFIGGREEDKVIELSPDPLGAGTHPISRWMWSQRPSCRIPKHDKLGNNFLDYQFVSNCPKETRMFGITYQPSVKRKSTFQTCILHNTSHILQWNPCMMIHELKRILPRSLEIIVVRSIV